MPTHVKVNTRRYYYCARSRRFRDRTTGRFVARATVARVVSVNETWDAILNRTARRLHSEALAATVALVLGHVVATALSLL